MATETKCPHCGKSVPITALGGICPECLLQAGAADTGELGPGGTIAAKPSQPAPAIAEIAPHFPQLEIIRCLGRGGMGAVYQARQPGLDRFVALKILSRNRDSAVPDAEFAERFQREARALARLSHPSIVAVYDFGAAGGFHFLLMEFVDGLTLRQLLQTKKLSPEEALSIVPKICEALQFAHEQGIVHRDIKPENILLDKQGRVKIADFGIAKIRGDESSARSLTGAKEVIGTPHYMAPEQVEKPATVDHRADIYSLGVVFYEMLTGELPLGKFSAPSQKVQVDVRLDEVVLHALEKEPARRYQHANEVKTDVETIAAGAAPAKSQVPHSGREAPAAKVAQRRTQLLWSGFIAGLLGLPVGVALRLPYVWGLSIAALVIGGYKLGWLNPKEFFGSHPHGNTNRSAPSSEASPPTWVAVIRWTARILGALLLAFYAIFILAEGLPPIAPQPEGVQLNFIALGLMLGGFAVGWKREGTAALLIASGWVLWHVSEGRMEWNLSQTPLPVAALYAVCWWVTRGRRTCVALTVVVGMAGALVLGRLFVPANVFVQGIIRDEQTGNPVAEAELRLLTPAGPLLTNWPNPNARTGDDGRFRLYVGWLGHQTAVTITATGYHPLTTNLGPYPFQRNIQRDFQLQPESPFGDLVERTLYSIATERPIKGEDLDAQREIAVPNQVAEAGEAPFHHWLAREGVDLLVWPHKRFCHLWTSLKIASAPPSLWTNPTRTGWQTAMAAGRLDPIRFESDSLEGFRSYNFETNTALPLTLAFTTLRGTSGMMQITELTPSPLGARIRYRVLRGSPLPIASPQSGAARPSAATAPPVVVETFPPSGATDIDSTLTELRVMFSKPMQDGRWSWTVWNKENFPETTGAPRFLADGKTCVLPVKLKPGKLYATWLNSDSHKDFADPEGRPAVPYLLIFETRK